MIFSLALEGVLCPTVGLDEAQVVDLFCKMQLLSEALDV